MKPRWLEGMQFVSVISMMAMLRCRQMDCKRVTVVDEVNSSSCRMSVEGHIVVRLFGIGRLAEHIIIDSTLKTLCALPAIIQRWTITFFPVVQLSTPRM